MKLIFAFVIIVAVCLFIYLIGKKGDVKKGDCNGCINCPMKDCAQRQNFTEE